ncbi:MAG: hypothetical protein EBZ59_07760, partial [Planctomycetia bacterium]|nr:hypothetical protein [Planctomycetia bacterium]
SLGAEAIVTGSVEASCERGRWSGRTAGVVGRVDMAAVAEGLRRHLGGTVARLGGMGTVTVAECEWRAGRLDRCRLACEAGEGRTGQETLDALVATLGCRAGPAFRSLVGDDLRGFDSLSFVLDVDGRGTFLRAGPGRGGSLVRRHGLSLLDEPVGPVATGRIAWFLSPSEPMAVPASDASAWLLSLLPSRESAAIAPDPAADPARARPAQAERPVPRSGF